MHNENIFRLILVLGFALVLPVGLYHRLKSQATGERLNRRAEGLFILLTLRPIGLIGVAGVVAYVLNPSWMAWSAVPLPLGLRWLGVGLGVVAAALLTAVFRTLGRNLTDTVVTRARHVLVTGGPYRWVRHPLYVAVALAAAAASLVTANVLVAATGAVAVALLVLRTRTEEAHLIMRFGDEYRAYVQRTGRFLPRLRT